MVMLEKLHGTLVVLGFLACVKRSQVSAFAGFGIKFARIETVLARSELAYHGCSPF
jgi:hypothetical protein